MSTELDLRDYPYEICNPFFIESAEIRYKLRGKLHSLPDNNQKCDGVLLIIKD